ncbi:MAPEG family protein [Sinorhizobium numidicum]|uniref:MAPEG family protein n=1 Tax=Sinorhizobium numidicum TaxID=680248 RepID=A0ABY8CYZ3_9HYPH|nr:MAPEG family protein [Sinorhizobium numidicum]WEX77209.1 MAPEG family protein [Sinorhizobium numidicum]WEX83868.1 MAPEG family protein [Sinorhizobium numidicum]
MSLELSYLLWSAVLAFAYVTAQAGAYRLQNGIVEVDPNRDIQPPADVLTGRATRALRNFHETYPVFVVLVIVVEFTGRSGALTECGTVIWFWARAAYLPIYVGGLGLVRSAVWAVSAAGLVLMLAGILI